MPTFGKFETTRELGPAHGVDSVAEVFVARIPNETPPRDYVVKVFARMRLSGEDEQTQSDLDPLLLELSRAFLSQVELQKKTAEQSPWVAPVIDSGRSFSGPWFATFLYPRTLHKVISGRVAVDDNSFLHVIRGVTEGALAFRNVCGRSHGNLKLANVLISGAGRLSKAEVRVSDPLPGGEEEVARYELADLRAIGRIIYQLVRRREIEDDESSILLPLKISKEWTDIFGDKKAPIWLEICNRLLDRSLSLSSYDLQRLAADLKKLEPKPLLPIPAVIGLAALVVIVGGVFIWIKLRASRPTPESAILNVSSDPSGAEIWIMGTNAGRTPLRPLRIPTNSQPFELKAVWWEKQLATRLVLDRPVTTNIAFKFDYGPVKIESDPPGAAISFQASNGDNFSSVVPFKTNQPVGVPVVYHLALKNYQTASVTSIVAEVHVPFVRTVKLEEMATGTGEVQFPASFNKNVVFRIFATNGEPVNARPMEDEPDLFRLPPGNYTVQSSYSNADSRLAWPDFKTNFTVTDRGKTVISNSFPYGRLNIRRSRYDPITISIGDNPPLSVTTPCQLYLPVGPFTLKLRKEGCDPTNVDIVIDNEKTTDITPQMVTPGAFVTVTTDPNGAEVLINGKPYGKTSDAQPALQAGPFLPGHVSFMARYPDLDDVTEDVQVRNHLDTNLSLSFNFVSTVIEVDPPTAELMWANGHASGSNSYAFVRKPGTQLTFIIKRPPDYASVTNVVVFDPKGKKVHPIYLPHSVVPVRFAIDPPEATNELALLDDSGRPVALDRTWFPWGSTVKLTGRSVLGEISTNVPIQKDQNGPVVIRFPYGTIGLTSKPDGAFVKMIRNGKNYDVGETPTSVKVAPGAKISFAIGIRDLVSNVPDVVVGPGQTKPVSVVFPVNPNEEVLDPAGLNLVLERVEEDLWVGRYDVTQWQFEYLMKNHHANQHNGNPKTMPADSVSWVEADQFCKDLNKLPRNFKKELEFRLPQYDEWLKFRADAKTNPLLDVLATNAPQPVGSKGANHFGICDAMGNVWQWLTPLENNQAMRVGLCYKNMTFSLRGAMSDNGQPQDQRLQEDTTGFRVVLGAAIAR